MLFGYDAGVLGGVQTTEPFLKAMGVGQLCLTLAANSIDHIHSTRKAPTQSH